jgi:hypothetical protein
MARTVNLFEPLSYTINYHNHETESIRIARDFLVVRGKGKELNIARVEHRLATISLEKKDYT